MEETYSAHGHVTITDCQTGETLVDKDNMIVATGRELIMNAVFGGSSTDPVLKQGNFKVFVEKNDTAATVSTLTYDSIKGNIANSGAATDITLIASDATSEPNTSVLTYTYSLASDDSNTYVTAVGLLYQKDVSTNVLFSRVMFDPIYMRATRTYKITYKVKF